MIDQHVPGGRTLATIKPEAGCAPWLWCSPADRPADTTAKRAVDRWLPRTGRSAVPDFVGVAALFSLAGHLPTWAGLVVTAVASLAGGGWCTVNFWRCRHAHCIVTGIGWSGLAIVAAAGAGIGHSVIDGTEQFVFLAILVAAALFETSWYLTRHSHAVSADQPRSAKR